MLKINYSEHKFKSINLQCFKECVTQFYFQHTPYVKFLDRKYFKIIFFCYSVTSDSQYVITKYRRGLKQGLEFSKLPFTQLWIANCLHSFCCEMDATRPQPEANGKIFALSFKLLLQTCFTYLKLILHISCNNEMYSKISTQSSVWRREPRLVLQKITSFSTRSYKNMIQYCAHEAETRLSKSQNWAFINNFMVTPLVE
jgi:hypothetical protein